MRRFFLRVLPASVVITLLFLGLLAMAPFTEFGSRLLLYSAAKFLPVQIEYAGGSLLGGLQLSRVYLDTEGVNLEIIDLEAKLELSCLWHSHFCFERLAMDAVDLVWDGGSWRSGKTLATLSIVGSAITVDSLQVEEAILVLQESTGPTIASSDTDFMLPVELTVHSARLERAAWDIFGTQYQHDYISVRGQWLGHLLKLEQVDIGDKDLGVLRLAGQLSVARDWPFELSATADWHATTSLASVLEHFLPAARAQLKKLPPLAMEAPWKVSISGTKEEQSISVAASVFGIGYEQLELSLAARHLPPAAGSPDETRFVLERIELRDIKTESSISGLGELQLGQENRWALSAQSDGFTLPILNDTLAGRLAGALGMEGQFTKNNWELALTGIDLHGTINDLPARIEGQVFVDEALSLSGSSMQANLNGAELRVTAQTGATQDLDVRLVVTELERWLPDSNGNLAMTATLSKGFESVAALGTVQDFMWQGLSVKRADFSGEVDLAEDYTFNLDAIFSAVSTNSVQLEEVSFDASGNEYRQTLQLGSRGDIDAKMAGKGELSIADARGNFTLEGAVTSAGGLLAEGYDLTGKLKLELDAIWNTDVAPRVAGALYLVRPQLQKDMGEGHYASEAWDKAEFQLIKDGESLQLSASGIKSNKEILAMKLILPGREEQPLSGELALHQLEIKNFQAFIPMLSSLEGSVDGKIQLSGTAMKLRGDGALKLENGSFSVIDNPTTFEALQLQLNVSGDKADIQGGLLLGGGKLDITGSLGYEPTPFVSLMLTGQRETLLFPPSTQLQVSHNLKLHATADYLDITGDLIVHEGVLEHEQLPEGGVALSEDVVIVGYTGPPPRPFDLGMDVQVTIEDHFNVVGSVVDVTVGGDLHLLQKRGRPMQLFGNLNVVGGELRAYGQHLQVRRGTVAFSGAPENPALEMRAERIISNENITVGMDLRGTLEDPVLNVYSDPMMPTAESLSYLIRGRGLDKGAAADGTALALSMGTSLVNQTGVLGALELLPGVNSVQLGAAGSEDGTTATVSGYIGRRIYLSYGVGLYEPINVLTARFYLQTRLWLEVVSSLENSLDLYYSFDIE